MPSTARLGLRRSKSRPGRLVWVAQTPRSHIAFPLLLTGALAVFVALGVPYVLENIHEYRPWAHPGVKLSMAIAGGIAAACFVAMGVMQTFVSMGWVGVLYGGQRRGRPFLSTPWGFLALRGHRLVLTDEPVHVRFERFDTPTAAYRVHGLEFVYVTQGRRKIRMSTVGRFDPRCQAQLVEWLSAQGLDVTHDASVVPRLSFPGPSPQ